MNYLMIIKLSLKELYANKLRSFLTMLGIIIGVFSIVIIISVGNGVKKSTQESIRKMLGSSAITVDLTEEIKYRDIEKNFGNSNVDKVAVVSDIQKETLVDKTYKQISVSGIDSNYFELMEEEIVKGRGISSIDFDNKSNVVVINEKAKEKIFEDTVNIGSTIKLGDTYYKIIGILKNKESAFDMFGNGKVYIPITTNRDFRINKLLLKGKEGIDDKIITAEIKSILTDYYAKGFYVEENNSGFGGFEQRYNEKFYVRSPASESGEMDKLFNTLSIALGGIAGISLLVGGVGIMNITFVSVKERTKEIGIRKSIGAGRSDIVIQFLIESFIISSLGGFIGLTFAFITGKVIGSITPIKPQIDISMMIVSVMFSGGIGVLFGSYPANTSAKLKPVDALRYE